jgi:hypothetical protein
MSSSPALTGASGGTTPRMSPYEKWSLAVSGVGFVLVIGSLLATWAQLKDLSQQNAMTVHAHRQETTLGMDRLFVEYPDIRDYFYAGKDIDEKDPSYPRVEAVAEMHLDVFDYKLKHAENFKEYQPFAGVEEIWMRDMFRTSPILRRYLQKRKMWYTQKLADLAAQSQQG